MGDSYRPSNHARGSRDCSPERYYPARRKPDSEFKLGYRSQQRSRSRSPRRSYQRAQDRYSYREEQPRRPSSRSLSPKRNNRNQRDRRHLDPRDRESNGHENRAYRRETDRRIEQPAHAPPQDYRPKENFLYSSPAERLPTAPVPDASRQTKPPAEQGKGKRPARRFKKRRLKAQVKAQAIAQQAVRLLGWRQAFAMIFRYPVDDIYLHETASAPRTASDIERLVGGEDGRWASGLHIAVTSWASEVPQLVFVAAAQDGLWRLLPTTLALPLLSTLDPLPESISQDSETIFHPSPPYPTSEGDSPPPRKRTKLALTDAEVHPCKMEAHGIGMYGLNTENGVRCIEPPPNGFRASQQRRTCREYRDSNPLLPVCFVCSSDGPLDDEEADLCRFQGRRFLYRGPPDTGESIVGFGFGSPIPQLEEVKPLPSREDWVVPPSAEDVSVVKMAAARFLKPILQDELQRIKQGAVYCKPSADTRTTCDICETSIFVGSSLSLESGEEYCCDCLRERKVPSQENLLHTTCFLQSEVETTLLAMMNLDNIPDAAREQPRKMGNVDDRAPDVPRAEIGRFSVHDLTDELFQQAFSRGPLVVTGIDLCWPPQQFIDIYGRHKCVLVDSETGRTEESDIHKFMGRLERPGKKKKFAILKDFPVDDLLSDACPRLCDEFFAATPPAAQRYLLPNAFCNLAAHLFKDNSVVPDLGPKMYAAEANVLHASKASTPLHLDMAPAMNICVYASDKSKEEGAAWDIFAAADTDKIRSFLRESVADETDWVQARTKYITDLMRKKLWDEYGVLSYRVYQKAGEAVFIPAGCAHQVRNLGDCIKVAIDFVPPWQLAECARVSEEIRGVPGREDLLQLRYMCWEALRSCLKYEASTSA